MKVRNSINTATDGMGYATGCTTAQLQAANPGINLTSLAIGQVLNLPSTTSTFTLPNTVSSLGTAQSSGPTADNYDPIASGIIAGGGGWSILADPMLLNLNQTGTGQIDNTYSAFWTQTLSGGVRPGELTVAQTVLASGLANLFLANPDAIGYQVWDPTIKASALSLLDTRAQLCSPTDPLVLDLNGDGVKLTDWLTAPVLFDTDHDGGSKEQTGWVSKEDGLVVMDLNGNGRIDDISETLSEYFNGMVGKNGNAGEKKYANGFAALKSLDTGNGTPGSAGYGDNQFTSADAAWTNVRVWVDANHDGNTDTGELKTFAALGITQINLGATSQSGLVNGGNEVLATGSYVINGITRDAQAANFLTNPNGQTISFRTNSTFNNNTGNNLLMGNLDGDNFNTGVLDNSFLIDTHEEVPNIHSISISGPANRNAKDVAKGGVA